jgi:hypothetical protein
MHRVRHNPTDTHLANTLNHIFLHTSRAGILVAYLNLAALQKEARIQKLRSHIGGVGLHGPDEIGIDLNDRRQREREI